MINVKCFMIMVGLDDNENYYTTSTKELVKFSRTTLKGQVTLKLLRHLGGVASQIQHSYMYVLYIHIHIPWSGSYVR